MISRFGSSRCPNTYLNCVSAPVSLTALQFGWLSAVLDTPSSTVDIFRPRLKTSSAAFVSRQVV